MILFAIVVKNTCKHKLFPTECGTRVYVLLRCREIFSQDTCVKRKHRNIKGRHKPMFPSQWETTFEVYEDMMEVLLVLEIFLTEDL